MRELFEFTTRQLKITRVYAPHLWRLVLFSNLLFALVFWGGIAIILTRAALGLSYAWPLAIVCAVFLFGTLKAALRLKAVALPLAEWRTHLRQGAWAHLALWPATSVLYLCNALAAGFSRRITWRGITYELISPTETAIIR